MKMNFGQYMDKRIKITFKDGETLEGIAYDFSSDDDNPEGIASVRVDGYELYENEIASIKIISDSVPTMAKVI